MDDIASRWERSKEYKLYYTPSMDICLTSSDRDYNFLKSCWFEEDEYISFVKQKRGKLSTEWRRRTKAAMKGKNIPPNGF